MVTCLFQKRTCQNRAPCPATTEPAVTPEVMNQVVEQGLSTIQPPCTALRSGLVPGPGHAQENQPRLLEFVFGIWRMECTKWINCRARQVAMWLRGGWTSSNRGTRGWQPCEQVLGKGSLSDLGGQYWRWSMLRKPKEFVRDSSVRYHIKFL